MVAKSNVQNIPSCKLISPTAELLFEQVHGCAWLLRTEYAWEGTHGLRDDVSLIQDVLIWHVLL